MPAAFLPSAFPRSFNICTCLLLYFCLGLLEGVIPVPLAVRWRKQAAGTDPGELRQFSVWNAGNKTPKEKGDNNYEQRREWERFLIIVNYGPSKITIQSQLDPILPRIDFIKNSMRSSVREGLFI